MMLADVGMAAGVGVLLILAFLVAVIGTVGLLLRGLLAIVTAVFRPLRRRRPSVPARCAADDILGGPCVNALCGHVNSPGARYCAKCGRRLRLAND
jgi:hypothetical protein